MSSGGTLRVGGHGEGLLRDGEDAVGGVDGVVGKVAEEGRSATWAVARWQNLPQSPMYERSPSSSKVSRISDN